MARCKLDPFHVTLSISMLSMGRLLLADLGKVDANLDYAIISKAMARFEHRLESDSRLREHLTAIESRIV